MITDDEIECPKCHKAMVLRINRKTGNPFYGCVGYPFCGKTLSIYQAEKKKLKSLSNKNDRLKFSESLRSKLPHPNYYAYINSKAWQDKRGEMLIKARHRCQMCNKSNTVLNVHHRTYDRLGHEMEEDLIVLCRDCHAKFHDKLPTP